MGVERGQLIVLCVARALQLQAVGIFDLAATLENIGARHAAALLLERSVQIEHIARVVWCGASLADEPEFRRHAIDALAGTARWIAENMPIVHRHLEVMRDTGVIS